MHTAENIKKVSLIFFTVLGLGHILSELMIINNYFLTLAVPLHRIVEIPFALSALIYAFTNLQSSMKEGKHRMINIMFVILVLLILGGLTYINFFIPDKIIH